MKKNLKIFYAVTLFLLIYVFPLLVSFIQSGANLSGNMYQSEISYIKTVDQLFYHFTDNFPSYLNIFKNPIFWFFISAVVSQKTMQWILEDD